MKHTKPLLLLVFLSWLSAGIAYAQTNRLYIPDLKMSRGCEIVLPVYMDNTEEVTAVEFTLTVPADYTIDPKTVLLSKRASNHQVTVRRLKNGKYKFVVISQNNAIINYHSGQLLTVCIKSSMSVIDEVNYPLTFSGAVMSTKTGTNILQEADGGTITIQSMPDLHIVSLDCSDPVAGQSITVKWKVRNDGRGSTNNISWKEYIWLLPSVSDGTTKNEARLLGSVDNISTLAPGEFYENTKTLTLPEREYYGNYDLVVTADLYYFNNIDLSGSNNEIPYPYEPETAEYGFLKATTNYTFKKLVEQGESVGKSDNFFYKKINIKIPPLPDLITSNVVAVVDNSDTSPSPVSMAGLASSSTFYSGKKVTVSATVKNQGGKDVNNAYISNALYICSTNDLSTGESRLLGNTSTRMTILQDESKDVTFSGRIPYDWYGDTYFIVQVDEYDQVYELANKENNICASKLHNTLLTPGADFEPYNLTTPSVISSDVSFDIRYSVRNIGPGLPYVNGWTDRIYISKSNSGIDETATLVDNHNYKGYYQPTNNGQYKYVGDEYTTSRTIRLKNMEPGTYYLYVKVDADDDVFEYNGEGNNVLTSSPITLNTPDLTAELVSISEDTLYNGCTAAFTWKLKNIGTADIQNATIKDAFYAAPFKIGEVTNTVSIVAGGEKTLRANITIPADTKLTGKKAVYMKTNDDHAIYEINKGNNTSGSLVKTFESFDDIRVIGKNITVYNIQAISEVTPGSQIVVSYNVKNTGTEAIDKNVTHEVWISPSADSYKDRSTLCSIEALPASIVGLQSGAFVNSQLYVTIPNNIIGGYYYLYVVVNRDKQLIEKLSTDNIVKFRIHVNGNLPDLSITDILFPEEVNTMEETTLSFTVVNSGDWDAGKSTCGIFLSKDDQYDIHDQLIDAVSLSNIKKGASMSFKKNIQIEDSVIGKLYIILKVDNNLDNTPDNNSASKAFSSIQSPLPDLSVSELSTTGELKGGQSVTINVRVTNMGDHATKKNHWTDCFYLSITDNLNSYFVMNLGSKSHSGTLGKNESYTASFKVSLPEEISGNYWLFAITNPSDVIYESNKNNNTMCIPVYIENASDTPAELSVCDISAPVQIKAGEVISLSYKVQNEGAFAADGILRDVIYLSKDNKWDEDDEMVGVVSGKVTIQPGDELKRDVTGRITNVPEGDYHFIIRTNSAHTIFENNYEDNVLGQSAVSSVSFDKLGIGSTSSLNTSGYFKIDIPTNYEGKTIGLYLSHPETSTAGLYAAYEKVPSTASFERHSNDLETTEQEVLIPNVQAGTYYVLAQDNASMKKSLNVFSLTKEQTPVAIPMTITTREVPFGASTLSIKEGGNGGWVTTEIRGALLDSIMDFRLTSGNNTIPAESITFKDQTSSMTTFNLNDVETGSYDVVSELPNGTQATLPDGFRVIPGTSVKLGVKLDVPGRVINGTYAPLSIAYANGGSTDIAIKEILIVIEGGYLSTTIEGLNEHLTELHFVPDLEQDKRGFVSIPPAKQEVFNCFMMQTTSGNSHLVVYVVQ